MGKLVDRTGQRSGRLTVVGRVPSDIPGRFKWRCLCECGGTVDVDGSHLNVGGKKHVYTSCGCMVGVKHGMSSSPEYSSWSAARDRCNQPSHPWYGRYGGRGITMCAEWDDFTKFYEYMGPRPPGTTLDRYPNNDGNYEPGNCRWATKSEQRRNREDSK